jgi:hypothetical protein
LRPLKSERARDEGVQYEAESAQTAEHRGISALVSFEPPPNSKQCRTNAKMIRRRQSEAEACLSQYTSDIMNAGAMVRPLGK